MLGLDLFSGAGGMSLGAKNAGIEVKFSVEKDLHAVRTYAHNFPTCQIFAEDIHCFDPEVLSFEPEIIFGGPPCQGYSTSNQRTRTKDNPQNWLFYEFLRIIQKTEPQWVVIENVKGILETEGRFFFNSIVERLKKFGYFTTHIVLNAVHYGVPQNRTRLFIIANKKKSFYFIENKCHKEITVDEAISDLPTIENGNTIEYLPYSNDAHSLYASKLRQNKSICTNNLVTKNSSYILERYKHIPPGGNWEKIPEALMTTYHDRLRCHTGIYHRLRGDAPSVVIGNYRKNMLIHPIYDRGLSVREAARIQSFPDWFEFMGTIGFQQQQVGNAVPPMLAQCVFTQILGG